MLSDYVTELRERCDRWWQGTNDGPLLNIIFPRDGAVYPGDAAKPWMSPYIRSPWTGWQHEFVVGQAVDLAARHGDLGCVDEAAGPTSVQLKTSADSLSYILGQDVGAYLKEVGEPVTLAAFMRGVEDKMGGGTALIPEAQATAIKQAFAMKKQAESGQKMMAAAAKNGKVGDSLQAENKKRPGVTVTKSGLQFETITKATGPKPTAANTVSVNYRGTLPDGKEFDSSYKRGQPATFPVGGVIPGWSEALQMMNVGGKYRLVVPPAIAYGEHGAGPDIGPNSTLIFEVELLKIDK
jgi:FKBP-type peptidyl-prolyl cis-trans isomerase